jgi:hypothetical protein
VIFVHKVLNSLHKLQATGLFFGNRAYYLISTIDLKTRGACHSGTKNSIFVLTS